MTTKVIVGDFELIFLRPMEQSSVDGPVQQRYDLIYIIGSIWLSKICGWLFSSHTSRTPPSVATANRIPNSLALSRDM